MKKATLLIAVMVMSLSYSQDRDVNNSGSTNSAQTSNLFGKNEFKINALFLILGAADLHYERILNEESSIGTRMLVTLDDEIFTTKPFYLDGYYRFFFGDKPAAGFFVEGLTSINSDEYDRFVSGPNFSGTFITERSTGFGLGLQIGGKFVTRRGILFEISGGVGRNFIQSDNVDNQIFGRFGLNVGYRF